MILPGQGAPKAIFFLPLARFWNTVMNSDSPGEQAFARAEQRTQEAAVLLRAVANIGRQHYGSAAS